MRLKEGDRVIITKENSSLCGMVANVSNIDIIGKYSRYCKVEVFVKPRVYYASTDGYIFYQKKHTHVLGLNEVKPHPTKIEDLL